MGKLGSTAITEYGIKAMILNRNLHARLKFHGMADIAVLMMMSGVG